MPLAAPLNVSVGRHEESLTMTSKRPLQVFRHVYLDVSGLDGLYAQITERSETERESTRDRTKMGRVSASLGLGGILGAFAGLADLKGSTEASASGRRIETTRAVLAPEQKLRFLMDALAATEPQSLYDDFDEAAATATTLQDAVFVHATDLFDAPQFYFSNGVDMANKMGAFIFERNMRSRHVGAYDFSDHYFQSNTDRTDSAGVRIIMSASLQKCIGARDGSLGFMSHDAIFLRAHAGKDIGLGVFGSMFGIPNAYQIKPFALWFCA